MGHAFAKRAASALGLDIGRARPQTHTFLASRGVDVVLDVGANEGQFGRELRAQGYRGRIVSFEPVSSVFQALQQTAARDGDWTAIQCALGEREGVAEINVSRSTVYSSLLPLSKLAEQDRPSAAVRRTESIRVRRLDDLYDEVRGAATFLKIDTQGFEQQVLRGAAEALKTVVGVQLELPCLHLYQRSWTFAQAVTFMEAAGFAVAQLRPVNVAKSDPASFEEIDCVFRRA